MVANTFQNDIMRKCPDGLIKVYDVKGIEELGVTNLIMNLVDENRRIELACSYFDETNNDLDDPIERSQMIIDALRCRQVTLRKKLLNLVMTGGED
jgi:hypothetical protein